MAEQKAAKRNKPKFLRTDSHKVIKLGKGVKKNQKWKGAKGRQNKLRMNRKGHHQRPKVGWGADSSIKGLIGGREALRIENLNDLKSVKTGQGILIANVGMKKRKEIIAKAKEMKLKILNRYLKEESKK